MTMNDLVVKVHKILPDAAIDVDNEGQIIVYTGKYRNDTGDILIDGME